MRPVADHDRVAVDVECFAIVFERVRSACVRERDAEAHAGHFWIRDTDSEGSRAYEKYLDAFDDIRLVQAYILGRARKHDVPVIENGEIEEAIGNVMELVLTAAEPLQVRG